MHMNEKYNKHSNNFWQYNIYLTILFKWEL